MAWPELAKMIGSALAGLAADKGLSIVVNWNDEIRVMREIQSLVYQAIVDDVGLIPEDRRRFEVAQLLFTVTPLTLDGLVDTPVYHIEVIKTALGGDDPKRTRRFGYYPANHMFWLELAMRNFSTVRAPSGYRVLHPEALPDPQPHHNDRNWFIPLTTTKDTFIRSAIPGRDIYQHAARKAQNVRARDRLWTALRSHCLTEYGQVRPDRHRVTADGIGLWLTPLNSGNPGRAVHYHLVAVNQQLSSEYPVRAVAFLYNSATQELLWLFI